MRAALERAAVIAEPFPHLAVADCLPPDFYRQLLSQLPAISNYQPLVETGRVTPGYSRHRYIWTAPTPDHSDLTDGQVRFLDDTLQAIKDEQITGLLFDKFSGTITDRFNQPDEQRAGNHTIGVEAMLVRDEVGYALGPHTDSRTKLVSCLIYLANDDLHPDLGTALYRPKQRGFTCLGGPHYDFDGFERIRVQPYLPNSLFAFVKTRTSFHGVEPMPPGSDPRNLILLDIRVT